MTAAIETWYRNAYTDNIRMNAMQMKSHLRNSMDFEPSRGEFLMLDSYGIASANVADTAPHLRELTATRAAATLYDQVPRNRRRLAPRFWGFTEWFDPRDGVKLMKDFRPDSQYSRAVTGAFGRQMDNIIVTAFDADAVDEDAANIEFHTGSTPATPTQDANEVLRSVGPNTGANVDKVIEAVQQLVINKTQADVPWYCALHPASVSQLFSFTNDDRLLSMDFSGMHPLKSGQIGSYMGVEFIPCVEIPTAETMTTSGGTGAYMWTYSRDAMVFSMDGDIEVHFDIVPEQNHSLQVAHYATFSATRMHEVKLIRTETNIPAA